MSPSRYGVYFAGFIAGAGILIASLASLVPYTQAVASHPVAPGDTSYVIYQQDGAEVDFQALADAADTVDVVLIGEVHTDPVPKELALELAERLAARLDVQPAVALSLEMFERDVQRVIDEYLAGYITEEHFLADSRPWPGYENHYRPLIETARERGWPVIAANPPRRYVNQVAREGLESLMDLSAASQEWLPPLPYAGPSAEYREEWLTIMRESAHGGHSEAHEEDRQPEDPHPEEQFDSMLQAQALWDAGMAHAISRQLRRSPETPVVHLSGSFHVESGTGIKEHLARYHRGVSTLLVTVRPVEDPKAFSPDEHAGLATFVILSDQAQLDAGPPSR